MLIRFSYPPSMGRPVEAPDSIRPEPRRAGAVDAKNRELTARDYERHPRADVSLVTRLIQVVNETLAPLEWEDRTNARGTGHWAFDGQLIAATHSHWAFRAAPTGFDSRVVCRTTLSVRG